MKKILLITAFLCFATLTFAVDERPTKAKSLSEYKVPEIDFSVLDGMSHPRLFVSAADIDALREAIKYPVNSDFLTMHRAMIKQADDYIAEDKKLTYKKDVSGRRILKVSRDAFYRIFACSYAYVTTSETKYVRFAESLMNTVCDFPDWNPSHYLDAAEMGLGVALGYDWLYDALSEDIRAKAAAKLYEYVICTTLDRDGGNASTRCTSTTNNWNQVCNTGVVAASIAVYEQHKEDAQAIIRRAIPANMRAVEYMYSPDGVYPEGAGYWGYGTNYQIALNTLLKRVFGTDFGLSDVPGFRRTGQFYLWAQSNIGKKFDYFDTGDTGSVFPEAWYFAERFNDPGVLYFIHKATHSGAVPVKTRLFPLYLIIASRYVIPDIPEPSERVYYGKGNIPVVIVRTGWKEKDAWLGIKGGYGGYTHGHLDVGSFVFEDAGVRWASETHLRGGYTVIEKLLQENHSETKLFNTSKDAVRWTIFSYSNREHSTLTVNDRIHEPYKSCDFTDVIDEPGRVGGTIDLSDLFGGDVKSAVRTAVIREDHTLEITDVISAPSEKPAEVRFTLVTDTTPVVGRKGVTLVADDKEKFLSVKGVKAAFQTWSTAPKDYPGPINAGLKCVKGKAICGYTYKVPAGKTVKVVTTLASVQ